MQQAAVKMCHRSRNKLNQGLIEWPVMLRGSFRSMSAKNWLFKPSGMRSAFWKNTRARPHDHEGLLDRLVEVLERPSVMVAVDRLQRGAGQ